MIQDNIYPIMGNSYRAEDFVRLDLSSKTLSKYGVRTNRDLESYLERVNQITNSHIAVGGYLEERDLYASSSHFSGDGASRNIHLGVDLWCPPGTPIYAPVEGRIHSFAYNDKELDYGYTLIVEHVFEGKQLHTLYGHLSEKYFGSWNTGKQINKGEAIAEIGRIEENGGWLPHLHFQLIIDLQDYSGDYPGVGSLKKLDFYRQNCPDPNLLIKPRSITKKAP